ncbi:MAG TPA: T9SS type A sorting domain-containing protein [Crocinitomicaceae bacterium]|nr:T9SS type A sorting domain-containing protein [Crocinitomicaceae bacterium]
MNIKTLLFIAFSLQLSYSNAASSWSQLANFGAEARHRGAGLVIGNKVYMGLGHYNGTGVNIIKNDWWQYDPGTNSWSQKANYVGNNGIGNYAVLTFDMGNRGFLGGGQQGGSFSEFFEYVPSTNTWEGRTPSPTKPQNTYGFVIGNKGYYVATNQLREYNSTTDTWTNKGTTPFTVNAWNSAFAIDGKGYIKINNSLWEYKPLTNQWVTRANFPGLATAGSVSFTQNGKGYIVGGFGGSLSNVNSEVWEFNPATNTWQALSNFLGTSRRFAVGLNLGNRAFLGTGTNGTNFNDFWEFDALAELNDASKVDVVCYPNPAVQKVQFKTEEHLGANLLIYNSTGQLISNKRIENKTEVFCRENNQAGVYFFFIKKDGQEVYSNKFIFQ